MGHVQRIRIKGMLQIKRSRNTTKALCVPFAIEVMQTTLISSDTLQHVQKTQITQVENHQNDPVELQKSYCQHEAVNSVLRHLPEMKTLDCINTNVAFDCILVL